MWLLNTVSLQLESFEGDDVPPYAILSHTWGIEELKFLDMFEFETSIEVKAGYAKVRGFCELVRQDYRLEYAWVDTCCINKESSAELSEAINSMYKWYERADVCIIYLADVPDFVGEDSVLVQAQAETFRASKWFTRGWTLQELIASNSREFRTQGWKRLNPASGEGGNLSVHAITGVSFAVLTGRSNLREVCIAERMSWVAHRVTTRAEDMAYCLMGIFNVNMPILYGEGLHSAFRRLQEEIMKTSFDQSLFAWRQDYDSSGLLACSPRDFAETPPLGLWAPDMLTPMVATNIGILFTPCVLDKDWYPGEVDGVMKVGLRCDVKTHIGWMILVLRLKLVENANVYVNGGPQEAYRRIDCDLWETIPCHSYVGEEYKQILVLGNDTHDLVNIAWKQDKARADEDIWGSRPLTMSIRSRTHLAQTSLPVLKNRVHANALQ